MATSRPIIPIVSRSLEHWRTVRLAHLDELEAAHTAVGGTRPGRRHATLQLNYAYAMMLSSQFQGFCRHIHFEAADHFFAHVNSYSVLAASVLRARLVEGRKLDQGNPNPGNIGSDFGRFGIRFWDLVIAKDARCALAKEHLEVLAVWRNAIAHNDFSSDKLNGKTSLRLADVQSLRRDCDLLAATFDGVLHDLLLDLKRPTPWAWR